MAKIQEKFWKRSGQHDYVDVDFNAAVNNITKEVSVWFTDEQGRHLWLKLEPAEAKELGRSLTMFSNK